MAPSDSLKEHVRSKVDFYELLSLQPNFTPQDLQRAYRKTAFKYHPDKAGDGAAAKESLHLTSIGYQVLSDPELRLVYDNAREARERKKAYDLRLGEHRRKLIEKLEVQDNNREWTPGALPGGGYHLGGKEERIFRLAEDGKRRILQMQEQQESLRRNRVARQQQENEQTVPLKQSGQDNGISSFDYTLNPFLSFTAGQQSLEHEALAKLRSAAELQSLS